MSAAIMLRQRDNIHLLVDAASYYSDGIVAGFIDKCCALPEIRCAVTTLGASNWAPIIFDAIRQNFTSFDDVKAWIGPLLERLYGQYADTICEPGMWAAADVWVTGWSDEIDGPDGFTISMDGPAEWASHHENNPHARHPFVVDTLASLGLNLHPCPTAHQFFEAWRPASLPEPENIVPELDLLQIMEMQRRIPCRFNGHPIVGGYAVLTTVDRNGVSQRRIHTWTEDEPGELIKPPPIDWKRWRSERERDVSTSAVTPLRLNRRERAKKDARNA